MSETINEKVFQTDVDDGKYSDTDQKLNDTQDEENGAEKHSRINEQEQVYNDLNKALYNVDSENPANVTNVNNGKLSDGDASKLVSRDVAEITNNVNDDQDKCKQNENEKNDTKGEFKPENPTHHVIEPSPRNRNTFDRGSIPKVVQPTSHSVPINTAYRTVKSPRRLPILPIIDINSVDQDRVNAVAEEFLKNGHVSERDMQVMAAVIVRLEELRDQAIEEYNCMVCKKAVAAYQRAKNHQILLLKQVAQEDFIHMIKLKKDENNETISNLQESYKNNEVELKKKCEKQMDMLREKHERELQALDEEWLSESKLRQFNKVSQELRALRLQQEKFMCARMFEDADNIRMIADRRQELEQIAMHKCMIQEYNRAKNKLIQKHKEEEETLREVQSKRYDVLKSNYDIKLDILNKRSRNLNKDELIGSEPEKLWSVKHRTDVESQRCAIQTRSARQKSATRSMGSDKYGVLKLPPLPISKK